MTASPLDSRGIYRRFDPSGLYDRIAHLPDQFEEAWAAARSLVLPRAYRDAHRVVVLGMGGSGIGGSLASALAVDLESVTPIHVVRGYNLPAFVDERALVIALSNSGNTEETVALFGQAIAAGARCIAVATGGELLEIASQQGVPSIAFEWSGEPRSAVGWSLASVLAVTGKLRLIPDQRPQMSSAAQQMRSLVAQIGRDVPERRNAAKQLARWLSDSLPVIVGAESLGTVAYRWRTQINENAKSWAISEDLPEQNHNAPVGYGLPRALTPLLRVVLLRHAGMHPRNRLRIELTEQQLGAAQIATRILDVPGDAILAKLLWALQFGDLTSYYLGLLHGVDPSEIRALEWLKSTMAKSSSGGNRGLGGSSGARTGPSRRGR